MKTKRCPFNKLVWLTALILCLPAIQVHAQTYANLQTNSVTGVCALCGVANPGNPVDAASLDDYSTFVITAGLLGVTVQQTLVFPAASTTGCDSLVIGIGSGNALLSANLFGGVTIQTFNGSTANNDAQAVDSSILRLLEGNTRAEVMLHPRQPFDRVKVTLNSSLLGLLHSFRLYYAYYHSGIPANPVYTVPQGQVCGTQRLPVLNHKEGTDYKVAIAYSTPDGALIRDTSFVVNNNDTIVAPGIVAYIGATVNISVQAVNPFTGCTSDSVQQIFHIGGSGALPSVDADSVTICEGNFALLHAYSEESADMVTRWYDAPTGGNWLFAGNYFLVIPDTTTTYYVTGAFICEYPQRRPVKVIVNKIPAPAYSVPQEIVCDTQVISIQNHQPGLNYNVRLFYASFLGPVFDTSYTIINTGNIIIPPRISYSPLDVDIYVQAIDPLGNCRSDTVHQVFLQGGFAGAVSVDQDSVSICQGDSATLHAFDPRSDYAVIRWYDAPAGGNLLFTGHNYTVRPATTTTYYVTAGFTCDYPQRVPVTVTVIPCTAQQIASMNNLLPDREHHLLKTAPLLLFPNPTAGGVSINSKQDLAGALLFIFDLQGREITQMRLNGNTFRLQGANGIYIIRVVSRNGQVYQSRVMLQK